MASLYDHKVYIHILGDDFRYDRGEEWEQQFGNFDKLRDYINKHKEQFNMHIEWGTLSTYYSAIGERLAKLDKMAEQGKIAEQPAAFPRVEGDFFTYADRFSEYWSGYFTTRPFAKRMGRELEWRLRSAELLASLAGLYAPHTRTRMWDPEDEWRLKVASEALGLFQHHDAITGTSKQNVMNDYLTRLLSGLDSASLVVTNSIRRLVDAHTSASSGINIGPDDLTVDYQRPDFSSLPQKFLLDIKRNIVEQVLVFNPLPRERTALVRLHANTFDVDITDTSGAVIDYQINPVWTGVDTISADAFELIFYAKLAPLSINSFALRLRSQSTAKPMPNDAKQTSDHPRMVTISVSNGRLHNDVFPTTPYQQRQVGNNDTTTTTTMQLENGHFIAVFDRKSGMLRQMLPKKQGATVARRAVISLKKYTTMRSGAYLFQPTSEAFDLLQHPRIVRTLRGHLMSQVDVVYPENIIHKVRVHHCDAHLHSRFLDVENIFDIRSMGNSELIMRVSTDYHDAENRHRDWFSDANGFQMQARRTSRQLPIQANYYPITNQAYIEAPNRANASMLDRLTLLVGEAHGAASLRPGELEVMLDRRLNQDDSRGMGQPVLDNKPTQQFMRLLFEDRMPAASDQVSNPTQLAWLASEDLNYPVEIVLVSSSGQSSTHMSSSSSDTLMASNFEPMAQSLPCDTRLIMMRPLMRKRSSVGLTLHRLGLHCDHQALLPDDECSAASGSSDRLDLSTLFRPHVRMRVRRAALNFITEREAPQLFAKGRVRRVDLSSDDASSVTARLRPMDLAAFVVHFPTYSSSDTRSGGGRSTAPPLVAPSLVAKHQDDKPRRQSTLPTASSRHP